jgi:tetratricopeptide (TPR) repeat protein
LKKQFILLLTFLFIPVLSICKTNSAGKDTISTASGLKYIVIEKGNGPKADSGKQVSVHYAGYLLDSTEFDNSYKRGKPIKFVLGQGQVIKGWDEGIALMKVGDKFRLIIPPDLGYGENGAGNGVIPPNATLIFDTQLMGVGDPKPPISDVLLSTIYQKGIDSAVTLYHNLYKLKRSDYDFDEDGLNSISYKLINNGMFQYAIGLLKLNSETYPDSYIIYDGLGEAYMLSGNNALAIQCFAKALKLNPKDTNAEELLNKLNTK